MMQKPHWLGLLAWTLSVCAMPVFAANDDPLNITVQSPPQAMTKHGYVPYRVKIQNPSDQSHTVSLRFPSRTHSPSGNHLYQIRRDLVIGAQSEIEVQLYQPTLRVSGSDLAVMVNGRRRRDSIPLSISNHGSNMWHGRKETYVLLGPRVPGQFEDVMGLVLETSTTGNGTSSKPVVVLVETETSCNRWPAHALGYGAYDGIILTSREFNTMPHEIRTALQRYVETGGVLWILGRAILLQSWHLPNPTTFNHFEAYAMGFGNLLVSADRHYDQWNDATWNWVWDHWKRTDQPFTHRKSIEKANEDWPVVVPSRIPARSLLLMTVAFALAIGPLNLFLLGRKNRKIWLWWTVPVISILTSVGIFVYATAAEGWQGVIRTTSLTLLDQRTHHATTIGYTAFYCPLTPRQGLMFDRQTELTPQITGGRGSGTGRSLDWTHGQHLVSGWVSARVPAHFQVRKSQPRQERLVLEQNEYGPPSVVNGLGVDIESLILADHDGQIYITGKLSAGAKVTLQAQPDIDPVGEHPQWALRDIYADRWENRISNLRSEAPHYLVQGSYLTTTNESPFLEPGLETYRSWHRSAVIYGLFQPKDFD